MRQYPTLSPELLRQLLDVSPSHDGPLEYRPCAVRLRDGSVDNCVYVIPSVPYMRFWGIYPEDDHAKRSVPIGEVSAIEESPLRLPVRVANELYRIGESGMGYLCFTLEFANGARQRYVTGNAIDFLPMPSGAAPEDVARIIAHTTPWRDTDWHELPYSWCLFDGGSLAV